MNDLQTLIKKYMDYCNVQKCLDEKTLKAYRIDLRQFSEQICTDEVIKSILLYWKVLLLPYTVNTNLKL